jgi:hypothetical protein
MEKKQTAVEWFWNNLTDDMIGDLSPEQIGSIYKLMEQAKQMEKERLKDAFIEGANTIYAIPKTFDEWYHETYGGQDEK